jgi:very-short-patch-repair endonuclease
VILFSICYGPDAEGVVRMNFGPLNNKGGERRLNVAITRARRELLVFSRLKPDQIDLSRTQATGVHHLRRFLDYAGRGPSALIEAVNRTGGEVESFFEQSVLDELTQRGWPVDAQVGCSGYRIDLAVRDPERPGRYLLGVECDGANYHSAASARDRDRLRQSVLESLGWRLHRIWSTDWWLQRPREIAKLEDALERALKSASTSDDMDLSPPSNIPSHDDAADQPDDEATPRFARVDVSPDPQPDLPLQLPVALPGQAVYRRFVPAPGAFGGELHDPANKAAVTRLVRDMVLTEAPLLFDAISSAVASAWNLHRAGSRVRDLVRGAVDENGFIVRAAKDRDFVWTPEQIETPYTTFRVPEEGETRVRTAMEICPEEIANAAAQVLRQHISMSPEDLARETARVFGITRLGTKVRAAFEDGLALMLETGACKTNGDNTLVV